MNVKSHYGILLQDIALLAFLISVFGSSVVVSIAGSEFLIENYTMLFLMIIATILVTFSKDMAAFITVGSQLIGFTAYKLFNLYAKGAVINTTSYLWLVLPVIVVGSMEFFCIGRYRLEIENAVLKEQVEELVVIDPLTGLYNLKSFYYDIGRQVSYSNRNKLPLTLMLIQLRYEQELKKLLSRNNFDTLKQRLVQIVSDAIRVEDRLYSIDKEGSLAVILTCDETGSELVRKRIRSMVSKKDAFDRITRDSIKVDLQIAYLQYNDTFGSDMMSFKKSVEKELNYDV